MQAFWLVGHRGAKDEAPENTVVGFLHASHLGLTAVELDVRLSRDNELVVIHDDTVDRTADARGPVAEFSAAELALLDARGTCPSWPERVGVPTLDQVLDVAEGFQVIQIELKRDTPERLEVIAQSVLETVGRRNLSSRVVLSSFEPVALEIIGRLSPNQRRAFIGAYDTPEFLNTALRLGCVQADMSLTKSSAEMVQRGHDARLTVVGWQCNSAEDLERALNWKLDAATSDVPSSILPLLENP